MKRLLSLTAILISLTLNSQGDFSSLKVHLEPGEHLEIEAPDFDHLKATIKNRSSQGLDISVRNLKTGELVSGFGLGKRGKETIFFSKPNALFIKNTGTETAKVSVTFQETPPPIPMTDAISLTLENTSAKSIPLIIPGVMNPNLSPFSKSGVQLKIGQEIFYKHEGKKVLILVVDSQLKNGDVIDVHALITSLEKKGK